MACLASASFHRKLTLLELSFEPMMSIGLVVEGRDFPIAFLPV